VNEPASFRDPAANVLISGEKILRRINKTYIPEYNLFMSKVYPELLEKKLIVPHVELSVTSEAIMIEPEYVPLISYPYEWPFAMIKEAALNTLSINRIALSHNMMLKDASAYNMQYYGGALKLIDTTSFINHADGMPWLAYPQFLTNFVSPLLLIKYVDSALGVISQMFLDGIPITLTAQLLPWQKRFSPGVIKHLYSQAIASRFDADKYKKIPRMSNIVLFALLDDLYEFVDSLKYKERSKGWMDYADKGMGSYIGTSLASKRKIVDNLLSERSKGWGTILDLGANTGEYSRVAANKGYDVIAVDSDHDCMNRLYGAKSVLPLIIDLCNPSPAIGWANTERRSFWDRSGRIDTIMALALIHHLCVKHNVPLGMVAEFLARHCEKLIIEWVPPWDKQAMRLLGEKNIPEYSHGCFLQEFGRRFRILKEYPIEASVRVIYKMEVR